VLGLGREFDLCPGVPELLRCFRPRRAERGRHPHSTILRPSTSAPSPSTNPRPPHSSAAPSSRPARPTPLVLPRRSICGTRASTRWAAGAEPCRGSSCVADQRGYVRRVAQRPPEAPMCNIVQRLDRQPAGAAKTHTHPPAATAENHSRPQLVKRCSQRPGRSVDPHRPRRFKAEALWVSLVLPSAALQRRKSSSCSVAVAPLPSAVDADGWYPETGRA
jgi:hypothetical protein